MPPGEWAPKPQGIPCPISSTIGMPLPLPGMPVQPTPEAAPQGGAQFVPGPMPPQPAPGATVWGAPVASGPSAATPAGTPFELTLVKTPLGFGMQLDSDNVVVAVKPDSQASRTGEVEPGDRVVALNGVEVSRDRPVKSVAVDLSDGESATFSIVPAYGVVRGGGYAGGGGGGAPLPTATAEPLPGADPYGLPLTQPQYA